MLYADQAGQYEARAGVPAAVAEAVAAAIAALTGLGPGRTVLDVGAGTGVFGRPLLALGAQYIGFDRSAEMLAVFQARLTEEDASAELPVAEVPVAKDPAAEDPVAEGPAAKDPAAEDPVAEGPAAKDPAAEDPVAEGPAAELHVADGNARWPAADGSVDVILSMRALHHLRPDHVVREVRRVARPEGAWLVLGRTERPSKSVRSKMRRAMRKRLRAHGIEGRQSRAHADAVFEALEAAGGERHPFIRAAVWHHPVRPADALADWAGKAGLAGHDVDPGIKAKVLAAVRDWAEAQYGDLQAVFEQEEHLVLDAIRLSG